MSDEKNKIIKFNDPSRKSKKNENENLLSLGSLNLELLISPDGKMIYFEPSFSIDSSVDDELFEQFCNLLKNKFSGSIDKLLEIYKETK